MVQMSLIANIWEDQPGDWFCLATKDRRTGWREYFFERDDFDDIDGFIARNRDKDVYWSVNGYDAPSRLAKHVVFGRWLYADLDPVNPERLRIEPTIAIESSPGNYQALWRCDHKVSDTLNHALADHVCADKGTWAANKVLRIPRTRNYKYDGPPRVKLLWDNGPRHRASELEYVLRRELRKLRAPQGTDVAAGMPSEESFDFKRLVRKYVKHRLQCFVTKVVNNDRSATWWFLAREMYERGAHVEHVLFVVKRSYAFKDKFEGQPRHASKELDRLRTKLVSLGRKTRVA
jgi:hypothetical protein